MSVNEAFLTVVYWFFIVLGIILLIRYIVGDSPLLEQLYVVFITGFMFKLYSDVRHTDKNLISLEHRLSDKIDTLSNTFNNKIDTLSDKLNNRIDALSNRVSKLEGKSSNRGK